MPKVMKSKLLDSYQLLMELRPCQIRVGLLPVKVSFLVWGIYPPASIVPSYCKITLLLCVENLTFQHLFYGRCSEGIGRHKVKMSFLLWLKIPLFCQAQPQLQLHLWLRLALNLTYTTTPPHPPNRKSKKTICILTQ